MVFEGRCKGKTPLGSTWGVGQGKYPEGGEGKRSVFNLGWDPLLSPNRRLLGFQKPGATVDMTLVVDVVQWQGVANPTIHLHTVITSGIKCALGVPLDRTRL